MTLDEPAELFCPDAEWFKTLRRRIGKWFDQRQRDLPWRRTKDAYAIWVSEIMLQQTQVATVVEYFTRFLERFPTVTALAEAEETEVLRLWEGLGYYRRARQLHAAAKVIQQSHQGKFPSDYESVLSLPGVGRYTAGAILSIAFDQRQPIVEANTVRLYSRLLLMQLDPTKSAGQRALWQFAEDVLPARAGSARLNQALMELGSMVCTPKSPNCDSCPVSELCPTNQHGAQDQIPPPKKRVKYEEITEAAIVVKRNAEVLLRRCAEGERWAGLWDFVRFESMHGKQTPQETHAELARSVRQLSGVQVSDLTPLAILKHGVTRYRITLHVYSAEWQHEDAEFSPTAEIRWMRPELLESVPLSVTGRKISELVSSKAW